MLRASAPPATSTRWLLSPALGCLAFFLAHVGFSAGPRPAEGWAGASTDPRPGRPFAARVVASIPAAQERARGAEAAPTDEEALLALLRRDGVVLFGAEEGAVISTPSVAFEAVEVDVIAASGRVRAARLAGR